MYGVLPGQRFSSAIGFYSHSTGTPSSSRHRPEATPSASSWGDPVRLTCKMTLWGLRAGAVPEPEFKPSTTCSSRVHCLNRSAPPPILAPRPSPPPPPTRHHVTHTERRHHFHTSIKLDWTNHMRSTRTPCSQRRMHTVRTSLSHKYTYKHNTNNRGPNRT